jgi:hypothetical protein
MAGVMEVSSQGIRVRARCFQTGVDLRGGVLCEPPGELRKAGRVVGEDAVAQATVRTDETGVELQFSDIKTESGRIHLHDLLVLKGLRRRIKLANASSSRSGEASDTVRSQRRTQCVWHRELI